MPQLNTTTSVVDYMKSLGQDASFTARKKLFQTSGLDKRLGNFIGSSAQNTALLKSIQTTNQQDPTAFPSTGSQIPAPTAVSSIPPGGQTATNAFATAAGPRPSGALNRYGSISNGQFNFNSPGGQGLGAQQFSFPVPKEGQVFSIDKGKGSVERYGILQGGQVFEFAPQFGDMSRNFGMSDASRVRGAAFTPEDVGAEVTGNFNRADLHSAFGNPLGTTTFQAARRDMFGGGGQVNIAGTQDTAPQAGDQKVGEAEFKRLRELHGVAEHNFDQYFRREGKDIFLKADAPIGQQGQAGPDLGSISAGDATASNVMESLGISTPSEQDLLDDLFNSPEFKFLQEGMEQQGAAATAVAQSAKDLLDRKYSADKEALEQKLSASGLTFSGIRATQVQALATELAASKLEADRKLASLLLDKDLAFRKSIHGLMESVIKEAEAGQKDAIAQLNKVGLAVVGNQLVPTLSAQNAARQEAKALDPNLVMTSANGRRIMIDKNPNSPTFGQIIADFGSSSDPSKGSGSYGIKFSQNQKQKLVNAGLENAPLDVQLSYIHGAPENQVLKNIGFTSAEVVDFNDELDTFVGSIDPKQWLAESRSGIRRTDSQVFRVMGQTGKSETEVATMTNQQFAAALNQSNSFIQLITAMGALSAGE